MNNWYRFSEKSEFIVLIDCSKIHLNLTPSAGRFSGNLLSLSQDIITTDCVTVIYTCVIRFLTFNSNQSRIRLVHLYSKVTNLVCQTRSNTSLPIKSTCMLLCTTCVINPLLACRGLQTVGVIGHCYVMAPGWSNKSWGNWWIVLSYGRRLSENAYSPGLQFCNKLIARLHLRQVPGVGLWGLYSPE